MRWNKCVGVYVCVCVQVRARFDENDCYYHYLLLPSCKFVTLWIYETISEYNVGTIKNVYTPQTKLWW